MIVLRFFLQTQGVPDSAFEKTNKQLTSHQKPKNIFKKWKHYQVHGNSPLFTVYHSTGSECITHYRAVFSSNSQYFHRFVRGRFPSPFTVQRQNINKALTDETTRKQSYKLITRTCIPARAAFVPSKLQGL